MTKGEVKNLLKIMLKTHKKTKWRFHRKKNNSRKKIMQRRKKIVKLNYRLYIPKKHRIILVLILYILWANLWYTRKKKSRENLIEKKTRLQLRKGRNSCDFLTPTLSIPTFHHWKKNELAFYYSVSLVHNFELWNIHKYLLKIERNSLWCFELLIL